MLREVHGQFPKPSPDPAVKGSAAATRAGERACRGKTPLEAKAAFYAKAIEAGGLEADSPEGRMIARLASFAKDASGDPSFAAGQLAADVYQATLPKATAQFGYQGCIYSLARQLERELASKK